MATPPRIAFVSPRFSEGPTIGGAETLLRKLAERLVAQGWQVDYLTTCARNHFTWENEIPPGRISVAGITVHYFPVDSGRDLDTFIKLQNRISRHAELTRDEELNWQRNNVNSQALYDYLQTEGHQYDRIVMGPYLFALVYFSSQIHPEKTLLLPCLHDEAFAYLKTTREMFLNVKGWIFNAEPERNLAQRLYGLDLSKAHVVGMGLDVFESNPAAFRQCHHLNTPYIIYSGRRELMKGTPILLDYLDVFRERTGIDLKLVLTGSGPYDPPTRLVPHILDLGFVSEQEKHDAMAGAVAFCHPSVNESFSIVILESWLAGTPVLVHGAGEVMPDHCRKSNGGFWFRNYPEFEESLSLFLAKPALRDAMGKAGQLYVRNFYAWPSVECRLLAALR
ncbi:MAG: glycosyltransferase family 4 protein [bacterium]|jgi:glycosyltransferase involved in cell wall biosynthesis